VKHILNNKNKKLLYDAWIESTLRYGIEIYGFATEYLIERLQKVQNKMVKILFGNGIKHTEELYKEYKILKVIELRDYIIITNNYFSKTFKVTKLDKIERLRRNTTTYEMPRWRNKHGRRIKAWYIPNLFNKIPPKMLQLTSAKEMKKIIKGYCLNH